MKKFDQKNKSLREQFADISWLSDSGVSEVEFIQLFQELMENKEGLSRVILKARTFEMIMQKARIAVDKEDVFQDKIFGRGYMVKQFSVWHKEVVDAYLAEEHKKLSEAWSTFGAYRGACDFGHISPNSQLLLKVGIPGILALIEAAATREGLNEKQLEFYEACKIVWNGLANFAKRLADAITPYNPENAKALRNLAEEAPGNIYEAMQLLILYFFAHEYIAGGRVRSLGRLDVLLYPFYCKDLEQGTYTKEEIREMLKFFLFKFWTAKVPYDLPFCLGGIGTDGNEVTNEMSYLIVEVYNELEIYSPKIHIRVSEQTPPDFVKLVLRCIRGGNSSFVFVNDHVGIKALMQVGIEEKDARNYVPIGCYEPAVWGVEVGCTGNATVNLAKALEFVLTDGRDFKSGRMGGVPVGRIDSYESFIQAIKKEIAYMTERVMDYVTKIEAYYGEIYPDPILSGMYEESVKRGVDVYEGGAKYNNSSVNLLAIATLVDAVAAVKRIVFEEKRITFEELREILKADWQGQERLQTIIKRLPEKYGNRHPFADELTRDFTDFCAALVNNRPNGRGGVFKAGCFSIDHCFELGEKTMATPDGRKAGEPLSKNLCAATGMDRNGITALINSVTVMDHSKFPNGSVLDIVLHPSAVQGEEGLEAFYGILKTYMSKGGFAMHGNVFHPEDLKKAQREPEKYANLQVRVCGWNAYFVNLSKAEQDAFIRQAEQVQ